MSTSGLDAGSLRERMTTALGDDRLQRSLANATGRFDQGRRTAFSTLPDPSGIRHTARAVRNEVLAELPRIVERFAETAAAAGTTVHWALDAEAANAIVVDIVRAAGAHRVVKGKSMATEETAMNDVLAEAGLDVIETDLGEWILQLADDTPSHLIAPAVHLDRTQIRDILQPTSAAALSTDPEELAAHARTTLRAAFLAGEVGITGCNLAIAETGSILLVENEGNGRMSTTLPRIHIAVMGVERIVETWEQADTILNVLARSATGQHVTTYTNVVTGPRRDGEVDGPDEVHVIVLDNGRSELLGTPLAEALGCIRCGACLNVCPVYRQVGGHAYGWVYSGPIGAVLTPMLAADHERAAELSSASTLCGACMEACPVEIPLQDLLLELRARKAAGAGTAEKSGWHAWATAWGSGGRYRASTRAATRGRKLTRLAGRMPGGAAWATGRTLPMPAARTFRDLWDAGAVR
ncbi:MAG: LutB/LldF family L-lactate oxidation iron-sulfur protein [Ilumatobacteraceae bacterium]